MERSDEDRRKLLSRLKRAEGQLAAVRRMVEDGHYCVDILTQVAAVRGALSGVDSLILRGHIEGCVVDAFQSEDPDRREAHVAELMALFEKWNRR